MYATSRFSTASLTAFRLVLIRSPTMSMLSSSRPPATRHLSLFHSTLDTFSLYWPFPSLFQHLAEDFQCLVHRRHTCVSRELKKDFSELFRVAPHIESSIDVESQLFSRLQGSKHGACNHLPLRQGQYRPGIEISSDKP